MVFESGPWALSNQCSKCTFFVWSLIASYWSFIGHWTSIHVTIASSRWHALWVILVFSALKNLLSPTWLAFTQFKPCWHICSCKKMFVGHWPLFLHNNSQPLTCLILTDWLQQIFSTAGFPRVVGDSGPISSYSQAPPCSKFGYRYGYLFLMLGHYHEPGPIWWAVIVQVRAGKKISTKMANKQLNTAKAKDTVKNCSEEAVCKGHKVPLLKSLRPPHAREEGKWLANISFMLSHFFLNSKLLSLNCILTHFMRTRSPVLFLMRWA